MSLSTSNRFYSLTLSIFTPSIILFLIFFSLVINLVLLAFILNPILLYYFMKSAPICFISLIIFPISTDVVCNSWVVNLSIIHVKHLSLLIPFFEKYNNMLLKMFGEKGIWLLFGFWNFLLCLILCMPLNKFLYRFVKTQIISFGILWFINIWIIIVWNIESNALLK